MTPKQETYNETVTIEASTDGLKIEGYDYFVIAAILIIVIGLVLFAKYWRGR